MRAAPVVNAVIQARSSSTRLPGKVLRTLGGRSVLGWVVRAAAAAPGVDQVVVATYSEGLYSAVSTCLSAAACTTWVTPCMARWSRSRSRMSPMKKRSRGSSPNIWRSSYCFSSSREKTTMRCGSRWVSA